MFWDIFYNLCTSNGMKPNAVCKELNLSNATATHWKSGTMPKGDILIKIADYFGCSVDYLLGRTSELSGATYQNINSKNFVNVNNGNGLTIQNDSITDTFTAEFIEVFKSLDIANKVAVMNLALEKRNRYKY